jgi:hypothetical protein
MNIAWWHRFSAPTGSHLIAIAQRQVQHERDDFLVERGLLFPQAIVPGGIQGTHSVGRPGLDGLPGGCPVGDEADDRDSGGRACPDDSGLDGGIHGTAGYA